MIENNNSLTCILILTEMCYYHVRHYEFYHVNMIINIMSINQHTHYHDIMIMTSVASHNKHHKMMFTIINVSMSS